MAEPWHRRPNETLQAFEAFHTYLTLGPERSNAKAAQALGKSKQLIDGWSRKHEWQMRIAAYEEHFALRALDETEELRLEMMREHLGFATMLLRKAKARIAPLVDEMPETDQELVEAIARGKVASVDQALRAGDLAVKIGRLATGLDGKYTPPDRDRVDLSQLDEDDLDKLEEIFAKAERKER